MAINKNPRNKKHPWQVDWREGGRRRHKSFPTRRAAEKFDADRRAGVGPRVDRTHEKKTVRQVHDTWWASVVTSGGYHRQPLAPKTQKHWSWIWSAYVAPHWQHAQLGSLTHDSIAEWTETMPSVETPSRIAGARTRQEAIRVLRKILDYAVLKGFLVKNPALNHLGKIDYWPYLASTEKEALTGAQLMELANELGSHREPYRAMTLLMGTSGTRPSETFALFPGDFYEKGDGRLARIHRTLQEDRKLGPTKNRRERKVPVFKSAYDLLPLNANPKEPLFRGKRSRYVDLGNWRRRVFTPAVESLSKGDPTFPVITPHGLRHTAVSLAIANGAPVHVVQKIADHAKPSTTMDVYRHLYDQEMVDAMGAVEDALGF